MQKKKALSDANLIKIGKYAVKLTEENSEYIDDMGLILLARYVKKIKYPKRRKEF